MRTTTKKKTGQRRRRAASSAVAKPVRRVVRKSTKSAKQRRKPLEQKPPRTISRRYLSPLGKSEVGARRIIAAVKAVKKAHERDGSDRFGVILF